MARVEHRRAGLASGGDAKGRAVGLDDVAFEQLQVLAAAATDAAEPNEAHEQQ